MVDLIMPHNRVTVCADLNSGQRVPIYIIMFDKSTPLPENVHSPLMPVIYLVPSDSRITVRCDPHPREVIRMYFIIDKLTEAIFVNVNSPGLSVMDLTMHYRWIRPRLDFEACDAIVVDVVGLEVPLIEKNKCKSLTNN